MKNKTAHFYYSLYINMDWRPPQPNQEGRRRPSHLALLQYRGERGDQPLGREQAQ